MKTRWSLSEEIYRALHRWPSLAGIIVLGCLSGWLFSYLFPPYYRAITYIYVALNPYRTYSDTNFLALARPRYSNIDDYKDWQMTQLESVIYLDEFMLDTLERLRELNPDWQEYSATDLRELLEADWRSAGTWSLIANSSAPELAEQAASIWGEVVLDRVNLALNAAQQTILIDQDLSVLSDSLQEVSSRVFELESALTQIEGLIAEINTLDPFQPLETNLRLQVMINITRLADFSPVWIGLLRDQPVEGDPPSKYLSWIEQAKMLIGQEIASKNQQINVLEKERTELSVVFHEQADASLGLSPNLELESIEKGTPEKIRPTTTFILIGGITAFLIWVLSRFVMITRKMVDE